MVHVQSGDRASGSWSWLSCRWGVSAWSLRWISLMMMSLACFWPSEFWRRPWGIPCGERGEEGRNPAGKRPFRPVRLLRFSLLQTVSVLASCDYVKPWHGTARAQRPRAFRRFCEHGGVVGASLIGLDRPNQRTNVSRLNHRHADQG